MTTSADTRRHTGQGAEKSSSAASDKETAVSRTSEAEAVTTPKASKEDGYTVRITIPLDRIASTAGTIAMTPVAVARRVLPAKGGLPLYLGLGALGVAGLLEWPVAVGVGIGYAVLRRGGPLESAHTDGESEKDEKSERTGSKSTPQE